MSNLTKKDSTSFDDMILMYQRFLRLIAILPFENHDLNFIASKICLIYYLISSIINWSMLIFYIINGGKIPMIDTILETVLVIGLNVRYYFLIPRRLELANLLDECREIWNEYNNQGHRAVLQFERKIRLLFKCLFGSSIFVNIMYSASAVTFTLAAAAATADNQTYPRFLPYKWYTENGADLWPGYKFNFFLQVLIVLNAAFIATTVDSAAPLLIMLSAGYFRALRLRISCISDDADQADQELVACSKLHQRILNFCTRIDKITRTLFFVQLLCTGYNVSLIGIKIAGSDPDRYKFIPMGLLTLGQLFIMEWAPDHLIDESSSISTAAYFVSLTWMRRRLGKLLVLIIARSQRPVQMTAAGIVNLSLENFRSMLTSALSFFTVLRNFNM